VTEISWPAKPEIFTIWLDKKSFAELHQASPHSWEVVKLGVGTKTFQIPYFRISKFGTIFHGISPAARC
jgi:hypothetical protein